MNTWILCSEQLPAPNQHVIVWTGTGQPREMIWSGNRYAKNPKPRWEETHGRLAFRTPTHWMPLPAPPVP